VSDRPQRQDFIHGSGQNFDREGYNAELTAWCLERIADALPSLTQGQPVIYEPTPCDKGLHDWQKPMFYEHRKPFCRRCGLETHS